MRYYTYVGIDARGFTYQFLAELFRWAHIWARSWIPVKKPRYEDGYDENSESGCNDDYDSNEHDINTFGDDEDSGTSIRTIDDVKGKTKMATKRNEEEITENDGNEGMSGKICAVMYNDMTRLRGGRSSKRGRRELQHTDDYPAIGEVSCKEGRQ